MAGLVRRADVYPVATTAVITEAEVGALHTNLGPWVSNGLLHYVFSIFGDIERCVIMVDDRDKPKSEGLVEFERKNVALKAVRRLFLRDVVAAAGDRRHGFQLMSSRQVTGRGLPASEAREQGSALAIAVIETGNGVGDGAHGSEQVAVQQLGGITPKSWTQFKSPAT